MKRKLINLLFGLLVTVVVLFYCVKYFDVSAYSGHLMSFSGRQISRGLASKRSFVPINDYAVVTANISKWYAPSVLEQPPIYNALDITLRIKGFFGYSPVSKQVRGSGSHVLNYAAHKGQRYDLYFQSYNYNYWNCSGVVYAYR